MLGYLLLWVGLAPVWSMATAAAGALVSDQAPSFDTRLTNVYDPTVQASVDDSAGYVPGSAVEFPAPGAQYGRISCERIGLDAPVYWYDSDEILMYGVGQSLSSLPPGFGGAIVLSGHNTTDFACLQYVEDGDVIRFSTNWCDYEYTVSHHEVYDEKALETVIADKVMNGGEELLMYTCYPFHAITGRKTERFTVFGDRTAGLDVHWKEASA